MKILAEISAGELIDKLTILELKLDHIADADKRANVERERESLAATLARELAEAEALRGLRGELKSVNARLWSVEDELRRLEREGRFDDEFVTLARAVYQTNDRRARLKREINEITRSEIVEEKSYEAY
jgi:hypothetical protein